MSTDTTLPELRISFDKADPALANQYANELKADLEAQVDELEVKQVRDKANTMDFGATLAIIVGSAAATAVAKGIQAWLTKRNSSTVTIRTADGEILATGVSAADARKLVSEALKRPVKQVRSRR